MFTDFDQITLNQLEIKNSIQIHATDVGSSPWKEPTLRCIDPWQLPFKNTRGTLLSRSRAAKSSARAILKREDLAPILLSASRFFPSLRTDSGTRIDWSNRRAALMLDGISADSLEFHFTLVNLGESVRFVDWAWAFYLWFRWLGWPCSCRMYMIVGKLLARIVYYVPSA